MDELSLVIFTVFVQAAAGMALFLILLYFLLEKEKRQRLFLPAYGLVVVLFGVGLIASFTHLGQPFRAFNTLLGLMHGSPMSIEIMAVGIFGGLAALTFAALWIKHSLADGPLFYVVTAASALVLLYVFGTVYELPTASIWLSPWTSAQFLATALILGAGLVSVLTIVYHCETNLLRFAGLVAVLVTFVALSQFLNFLSNISDPNVVVAEGSLPMIRYGLLIVGCLMWLGAMFIKQESRLVLATATVGVALVVCSELAGRIHFYDLLHQRLL